MASSSEPPSTHAMLRLCAIDPPQYGWTACGGIASILEPTEMARRRDAKEAFLRRQREARLQAKNDAKQGTEGGAIKSEEHYTISDPPPAAASSPSAAAVPATPGAGANIFGTPASATDAPAPKKQIAIQSTTAAGVLDIYTYRRGRVGEEPRDPGTGELLCDTDPLDTTYGWEPPPSSVVKVTVKFPLEDPDDSDEDDDDGEKGEGGEGGGSEGNEGEGGESKDAWAGRARRAARPSGPSDSGAEPQTSPKRAQPTAHFVETVKWDLADPSTPSAEEYAAGIATEFGLNFAQAMDLKESIERQISAFIRSKPQYHAPIPLVDPYGGERPAVHIGPPETHVGPVLPAAGGGGARPLVKRSGSSLSGASGTSRPRGAVLKDKGKIEVVPKGQAPTPGEGCVYSQEVLRRAKAKSQEMTRAALGRGEAALEIIKNEVCHICHNRKELGLTFPCGRHSYCDFHCATRLSFRVKEYDKKNPTCLPIDYCPVCAAHCTCSKCKRRLENVADKMKAACRNQNCGIEDVVMDNLFDLCCPVQGGRSPSGPSSNMKKKKKVKIGDLGVGIKRGRSEDDDGYVPRPSTSRSRGSPSMDPESRPRKKRKTEVPVRKSVLKVPPSVFPKELSSEKDLDPSTPEELSHIFTPDGMFPRDGTELVEQRYQKVREIPSEGHFAQCAVCVMADTLGDDAIRCTKCPRAYHKKCVEKSCSENAAGNEKWECARCQWDREIQEDEEIPTTTVADRKVEKTYAAYKDGSASFAYMTKTITELLAILDKLTTSDYGWIFAAPVSTEEVKDYRSVVKKPMDYGTIARKLENGEYAPSSDKPSDLGDLDEMEELVLYALMDISQVHYNCFLYNLPGSQYSRSGEVQQRKWRAYYNKYLKEGLPESIGTSLDSFLETCEKERREAVHDRRFQISGTPNNTVTKAVAVFDPDTKMIVKQYSSKASARNAAMILMNAGYDCEVELTQSNSKTRMEHAEDPSKTLFGYQWLPMETLKSGNFKVRPFFRNDDLASPNPNNIVIIKEEVATGAKLRGFESEESAWKDFVSEKEESMAESDDAKDQPESLADFVRDFLDGDGQSINGHQWKRVEPAKEDAVASAPTSPKKCVFEEEHVQSPRKGGKSDDGSSD